MALINPTNMGVKLCTVTISASLAEAYDELVEAIPQQEQLGSDETGIKDNGKKHWIWCITAATFRVFHIAASRSREVLEKLVGPDFAALQHSPEQEQEQDQEQERLRFFFRVFRGHSRTNLSASTAETGGKSVRASE